MRDDSKLRMTIFSRAFVRLSCGEWYPWNILSVYKYGKWVWLGSGNMCSWYGNRVWEVMGTKESLAFPVSMLLIDMECMVWSGHVNISAKWAFSLVISSVSLFEIIVREHCISTESELQRCARLLTSDCSFTLHFVHDQDYQNDAQVIYSVSMNSYKPLRTCTKLIIIRVKWNWRIQFNTRADDATATHRNKYPPKLKRPGIGGNIWHMTNNF